MEESSWMTEVYKFKAVEVRLFCSFSSSNTPRTSRIRYTINPDHKTMGALSLGSPEKVNFLFK